MRKRMTACVLGLLAGLAVAQQGDRPGEPQTVLPSHWQIPPAPVLSPAEELKTFQLADEFLTIELFASEPMVQDPVAMDFDADGRLWVVEMRGYMPDIDGRGENEPVGRVSILADADGDGRADQATVFLDKLVLPRAIKVCWGGALVAHDEKLWFAKDTNGDDVADVRELVDEDYIQSGNPEHQPNGLLLALDNWIYSAKSDQRYRRVGGKWLKEKTEFRGQWGITQDDFGRLYYNVNYSQLHADLFPPNYSLRNTNFVSIHAINQRIATNQTIFTLRPNTGVNRAYRPGILDERGHLKEFTSACAPLVYRGGRLFGPAGGALAFNDRTTGIPDPAWWLPRTNSVFVCEPAANLIKRNLVWDEGPYLRSQPAYEDREFLASTDERFRPVWLANAPDGSLFIADMYRGINQHRQFMTSHLRQEVLARGLDKGINLGRIWRVQSKERPAWPVRVLSGLATPELVKELNHRNGWVRDTAQRLIIEREDPAAMPLLERTMALATRSVHCLWTMEGMLARTADNGVTPYEVKYQSPSELFWQALLRAAGNQGGPIRIQALRVAELFAGDDAEKRGDLEFTVKYARWLSDPVFQVQATLSLGAFAGGVPEHDPHFQLMKSNPGEPLVREAFFAARPGLGWGTLRVLLVDRDWNQFAEGRDIVLQGLAALVVKQRDPAQIAELLRLVSVQKGELGWRQLPLLNGLLENRVAFRRNPIELRGEPPSLVSLRQSDEPLIRSAAETISSFIEWPGHKVERPPVVRLRPLTGMFAQQFAEGRALFQKACAACHGLTGEGLPNLAPPLLDSEWVMGSTDRLIQIILHGLEGPIEVNGRKYEPPAVLPSMPAVDSLSDSEIAAVLSYVTREMGQRSRTNSADQVTVIRNRFAGRQTPWTAAELQTESQP